VFLFPAGNYSVYNWTGGSFLRWTWWLFLAAGWLLLSRGRSFWAGVALGAAAVERVFPVFFLLGALAPLVWRGRGEWFSRASWSGLAAALRAPWRGDQLRTPAQQAASIAAGALVYGLVIVVASSLLFGAAAWPEFQARVDRHSGFFYTNHLGLAKVLVYTPELDNTAFDWRAPERFQIWSAGQAARRENAAPRLMAWGFCLLALAAALRVRSVVLSSVVVGGGVTFGLFLPAQYYWVYLAAAFALVFLDGAGDEERRRESWPWLLALGGGLVAANVFFAANLSEMKITLGVSQVFTVALLAAAVRTVAGGRIWPWLVGGPLIVLFLTVGRLSSPATTAAPPGVSVVGPVHWEAGELEPVRRQFLDRFGRRIADDGFVLARGESIAGAFTSTTATTRPHLLLRTDRCFRGVLNVTVDGIAAEPVQVGALCFVFDYVDAPLSAAELAAGEHRVEVAWRDGADIGVFRAWATAAPVVGP